MNKFFLCIILLIVGCTDLGPDERNIKILNKSQNTIYCILSSEDKFESWYKGFDTSTWDRGDYNISKDSFNYVYDNPRNWEEYIASCPNGKLKIFIISKDEVVKNGWAKVLTNNIYSKVYKVDINDLNKNGWTITYP